jgi:hypothetical protein
MKNAIGIATVVSMLALSSAALAAPGDNGGGVGGCIQTLYGNTTNPRPSGNGVLPSQSPGPFLNIPPAPNEPPRNDRTRGPSVGDVNGLIKEAAGAGTNVQDFCRAFGEFP